MWMHWLMIFLKWHLKDALANSRNPKACSTMTLYALLNTMVPAYIRTFCDMFSLMIWICEEFGPDFAKSAGKSQGFQPKAGRWPQDFKACRRVDILDLRENVARPGPRLDRLHCADRTSCLLQIGISTDFTTSKMGQCANLIKFA